MKNGILANGKKKRLNTIITNKNIPKNESSLEPYSAKGNLIKSTLLTLCVMYNHHLMMIKGKIEQIVDRGLPVEFCAVRTQIYANKARLFSSI